jgi:hypothetical protein
MHALRLESRHAEPALREVAMPEPGPGEARVRIGGAVAGRAVLVPTTGDQEG